jgi:hypothetical protein
MTSTAAKSAMAAEGSQSGSLLPLAVMLIPRVAACGYAASGTARARARACASVARMQRSA